MGFQKRCFLVGLLLFVFATGVCLATNLIKNGDLEGEDLSAFLAVYSKEAQCTRIKETDGNDCHKFTITSYRKNEISSTLVVGVIKG